MPKLTIDGTEYNVPTKINSPVEILNQDFQKVAYQVLTYKKEVDANAKDEEIMDILIQSEENERLLQLNEESDREVVAKWRPKIDAVEQKHKQAVTNHYKERANSATLTEIQKLEDSFIDEHNNRTADDIGYEMGEFFLGKEKIEEYKQNKVLGPADFANMILENANKSQAALGMSNEKYDKFIDLLKVAPDVANLFVSIDSVKDNARTKTMNDIMNDPDGMLEDLLDNDDELNNMQQEMENEKIARRKQNAKDVKADKNFPAKKYKESVEKDASDLRTLVDMRAKIAKQYDKAPWYSLVARWIPFIPNSWSHAGQLQNKLDAIDAAIAKAGYNKDDISKVSQEIKDRNNEWDVIGVNSKGEADSLENIQKGEEIDQEAFREGLGEKVNETREVQQSQKIETGIDDPTKTNQINIS